jgi:acid stress-induced BolA-like protein IbaG/YrbA
MSVGSRHLAAILAWFAGVMLLSAPVLASDKGLEKRLTDQGYTFEIDSDGDYRLVVSWNTDQRSQIVFVSGGTEELGALAIREIFAPAANVKKHRITGAKALELLAHAGDMKVGSWEIRGDIVYYVATVPDSLSAAELDKIITVVAEIADNKEIELTRNKDGF